VTRHAGRRHNANEIICHFVVYCIADLQKAVESLPALVPLFQRLDNSAYLALPTSSSES
jgi:hypothetical protein